MRVLPVRGTKPKKRWRKAISNLCTTMKTFPILSSKDIALFSSLQPFHTLPSFIWEVHTFPVGKKSRPHHFWSAVHRDQKNTHQCSSLFILNQSNTLGTTQMISLPWGRTYFHMKTCLYYVNGVILFCCVCHETPRLTRSRVQTMVWSRVTQRWLVGHVRVTSGQLSLSSAAHATQSISNDPCSVNQLIFLNVQLACHVLKAWFLFYPGRNLLPQPRNLNNKTCLPIHTFFLHEEDSCTRWNNVWSSPKCSHGT